MNDRADPFDPSPAATLLAEVWRAGDILSELPSAIRPRTMAQGYDIQDRLIAELGEPTAGWKLGVGSVLQKRQSGVGRSIAGRVLRSRVYDDQARIELPNAAPVTVEFEIAFVLARDVLPDEPDFPVLDAVAEIRATFELVLARFTDRRAVGWPSFAADNAGFDALVVGQPLEPGRLDALREDLAVDVDGVETARSLSGDNATDPVAALGDLVAVARERGMVLPRGSIVSTGTVSKPFDVSAPEAEITARFLGERLGFHIQRRERAAA